MTEVLHYMYFSQLVFLSKDLDTYKEENLYSTIIMMQCKLCNKTILSLLFASCCVLSYIVFLMYQSTQQFYNKSTKQNEG
jgi:hypothetical protein